MKSCAFCGVEFQPKAPNQIYCSNKCKRSLRVKCEVCSKEIIRHKRNDGIYFCSRKCAMIYAGKTTVKKCPICNEMFTVKTSRLQYGWGKYCSKACANKGLEIDHYLTCQICGKTFLGDKNNWMHQKYCSRECTQKAVRIPIEKDLLSKLYVDEDMTSREIGRIIGRSKKIVLDYLKFYGIAIKPDGIKNRERIKCTDGHLVRSHYERAFDNALHRNGLTHEYDPRLPFACRYMADFKVQDVYVEIWGMMNIKQYCEKRERKIQIYHENGCKLLEVFPEDFKNINNKIDELKSLMKT